MERFEKERAVVRTKPFVAWLRIAGVVIPAMAVAPWAVRLGLGAVAVHFTIYMAALMVAIWQRSRTWREGVMDVRADADGVVLGRSRLDRRKIASARVRRDPKGTFVRLDRRFFPVEIGVADEEEGRSLIETLRLDVRSRAAPYLFLGGTRRQALTRTAAVFGVFALQIVSTFEVPRLLGPGAMPLALLLPIVLFAALRLRLGPMFTRIVVGADGLRVRRDLGREAFVPYADVEGVTVDDGELVIRRRSDAPIRCAFGGRGVARYLLSASPNDFGSAEEQAQAFRRHVEEAIELQRLHPGDAVAALARGGRSATEWIRELGELAEGRARYRVAAPPPEVLWRVVEDPGSAADARAAAAVVLRRTLDGDGAAQLRAVAEACAETRLRVALETVASPEASEAAVVHALDALEEDAVDRAARVGHHSAR